MSMIEEWFISICLPTLFSVGMAIGLFIFAYCLYRILLIIFRKIFRRDGLAKKLVEALRGPILVILFEIAAIISVNILGIREKFERFIRHSIVILIIGTLGWVLASILRAIYKHFIHRLRERSTADISKRSILTQLLFLYRLLMFIIIIITAASILMTFPYIKSVGVGILGSAGIVGIALGVAARPILLNLMAGFQIAVTKTITIGDAVFMEGDFAYVEAIHLTHVIARTWDLRRLIVPISYFIDKPFQNWDTKSPELLGSLFLYCDYTVPVKVIRQKVEELAGSTPLWNGKVWGVHVTNCTDKSIEIRIILTADDAPKAFELRAYVREKLIEFMQKEYPHSLPCVRYRKIDEPTKDAT